MADWADYLLRWSPASDAAEQRTHKLPEQQPGHGVMIEDAAEQFTHR